MLPARFHSSEARMHTDWLVGPSQAAADTGGASRETAE